LTRTVEFVSEIENIYSSGCDTFLEVGPGNVLSGLVNSILEGKPFSALSLDQSRGKRSGQYDLGLVLARLAAAGRKLNLGLWDQGYT
ncbi:MAG: hypothetical protein GTO60_03795, partial [Gammaproteobacteria bacterium]|nr:hypothetical protein [Gammaproteobacteria bacterium]